MIMNSTSSYCVYEQPNVMIVYLISESQDSSFALNQRLVCALHPVQFPKNSLSHSIGSYALAFA